MWNRTFVLFLRPGLYTFIPIFGIMSEKGRCGSGEAAYFTFINDTEESDVNAIHFDNNSAIRKLVLFGLCSNDNMESIFWFLRKIQLGKQCFPNLNNKKHIFIEYKGDCNEQQGK